MKKPEVSLVPPCNNEEDTLEEAIDTTVETMDDVADGYEIIIVEDGSYDSTPEIAQNLSSEYEEVSHLHRDERLGRGKAVETGFEAGKGEKLVYMDADMSVMPYHLGDMIDELDENDVVVGSRHLPDSEVERSLSREVASRTYNKAVRSLFSSDVKDHQCGFKGLRRDCFDDIKEFLDSRHWFWDTELILTSQRRGHDLQEIPVNWTEQPNSKVNLGTDIPYFASKLAEYWLNE